MLADADDALLDRLRAALSEGGVTAPEPRYLEEPRGLWQGRAAAVLRPRSAEEVAEILRICGAARVGVVPYGGGTGLVGGQVSPDGPLPVLLSLERMNAIRAVYPEENVLVAEAGAILVEVQQAADAAGRLFPLSLASEGSARIGGLLGTNAGGTGVLRYGNARDMVLGLEAVLPDGTIWHGLKRLRKDNTGYDLRHLLVGAEGTLGVITAAALRLSPRPAGEGTAMMVVPGPAEALHLLALARDRLGEAISAFELIAGQSFDFLAETMPEVRRPWTEAPEWVVLIDIGLAQGLDPAAALEGLFEQALEAGLVEDGVIARSEAQRAEFWTLRESIPLANREVGAVSSHDVALPLGAVAEFIARGDAIIAGMGEFRVNCFGHLGDGNLHYNVYPPKGAPRGTGKERAAEVKRAVHDLVHEMGGSVSAEHGIGRAKTGDLERYGDPAKLAAMRAIKAALDPAGIMNPGAVLR